MKKKILFISFFSIFLIGASILAIHKNTPKTIIQDGAILALTLDGESITSFPTKGNYHIDIECINGTGKWLTEEWKLVLEDITGDVSCDLAFTTKTNSDTLISVVESNAVDITTEYTNSFGDPVTLGYRYEGGNPDNYIWFNNEMWRIIGSVPTIIDSSGTQQNLVKIIRKDSIGAIAYDGYNAVFVSTWGGNTLYTLLNSYYYGAQDATDTSYCYSYQYDSSLKTQKLCDYTTMGIDPTDYYGKMVENVYWNIDGSSNEINALESYKVEVREQTLQGYVGLMSQADYLLANSYTHNVDANNHKTDHLKNNWLFSEGNEWTSTHQSWGYYTMWITDEGYIAEGYPCYGRAVRPVVYLDSEVFVVSGSGTEADPYMIGMN